MPAIIALLCLAPVSVVEAGTGAGDRSGVRDWSLTLLQVVRGLMTPTAEAEASGERAPAPSGAGFVPSVGGAGVEACASLWGVSAAARGEGDLPPPGVG
ncbi:MAG: hypothetical protein ACF8SC_09050 [Phycisphaerales bacterium JB037]